MEPADAGASRPARPAATTGAWLLAAAIWPLCAAAAMGGKHALAGVDSYYHVRVADIMRATGSWGLDAFPWVTATVWADRYHDKDWLFHVLLAPLTAMGTIEAGQAAVLAMAAAAGACWSLLFRALGCRHLAVAMLATLFCCGPAFYTRLLFCRPHVLSIALAALVLLLAVEGRRWLLAAACAVYALAYAGSWQAVVLCACLDAARGLHARRAPPPARLACLWAAGGLAAGMALNPYFPENVRGLFIQNVLVLKTHWLGADGVDVAQGAEFYAPSLRRVLSDYSPLLLVHAAAGLRLWRTGWRTAGWQAGGLWALATFYLALTMASQKFTDYSAPLAMAAAAAVFAGPGRPFDARPLFRLGVALVSGALAFASVRAARRDLPDTPPFLGAARFLSERYAGAGTSLRPEVVVFCGEWGKTPLLFHHAPEFRHPVFLEPFFMYMRSPRVYKLWRAISEGRALAPAMSMRLGFDAPVAFAPPGCRLMALALDADADARLVYLGPDGSRVYELR